MLHLHTGYQHTGRREFFQEIKYQCQRPCVKMLINTAVHLRELTMIVCVCYVVLKGLQIHIKFMYVGCKTCSRTCVVSSCMFVVGAHTRPQYTHWADPVSRLPAFPHPTEANCKCVGRIVLAVMQLPLLPGLSTHRLLCQCQI